MDEEKETEEVPQEMKVKETWPGEQPKKDNSHTTMYVSYAKDIFCAIFDKELGITHEALMKISIDLVKQARTAFS